MPDCVWKRSFKRDVLSPRLFMPDFKSPVNIVAQVSGIDFEYISFLLHPVYRSEQLSHRIRQLFKRP